MKKSDNTIQISNDLLKINTDRVERYKKASYDTGNSELKSVFCAIADESRKNITDISKLIMKRGESITTTEPNRPVNSGKIYRSWVDVKSKFNGTLRNNLLNSCEFEEMAAMAAYTMAKIDTSNPGILELLDRQQDSLKTSLEIIKAYRQAYDKLDKVMS